MPTASAVSWQAARRHLAEIGLAAHIIVRDHLSAVELLHEARG